MSNKNWKLYESPKLNMKSGKWEVRVTWSDGAPIEIQEFDSEAAAQEWTKREILPLLFAACTDKTPPPPQKPEGELICPDISKPRRFRK